MSQLRVVVFSKNRPLQLDGYLSSICSLTDICLPQITVIADKKESYKQIQEDYSLCNFVFEETFGFDQTIRAYFQSVTPEDYTLFGCDDCVIIRPLITKLSTVVLEKNPHVIGFSIRLGNNISGASISWKDNKISGSLLNPWRWPEQSWHWGYPFELMGTVYRNTLIQEIIAANKNVMKCPNYLESFGVNYCIEHKKNTEPVMAMFNTNNYLVACDMNRVQNDFPNKFTGTDEQNPEALNKLYAEGKRMDWQNLFNITPQDVFVGNTFFKVR